MYRVWDEAQSVSTVGSGLVDTQMSAAMPMAVRATASAVPAAKPAISRPAASRRTFFALPVTAVWPMETWPSPAMTVEPPLRTARMVVACQSGNVAAMTGHVDKGGDKVKAAARQA